MDLKGPEVTGLRNGLIYFKWGKWKQVKVCTDGAEGQIFATQGKEDLRKVDVPQTPQLLDTQK